MKHVTMPRILALVTLLATLGLAASVMAHPPGYWRDGVYYGPPRGYYYAPPPRRYYAPPPAVYVAPPPPVYVAPPPPPPPPVYVAPPPPPGINLVIPFTFR